MSQVQNFGGASVFNARDLKASELAEGFIAPAAFKMLLSDSHCVLEGPRGSGKTTLLRMLTPESYAPWCIRHDAKPIDFVGVFVPADVRWAKQLEARLTDVDAAISRHFMESAFTIATSLAIIEAIECCDRNFTRYGDALSSVFFKVPRAKEAALVRELARLWGLDAGVPSFSGLKSSLRARQHDIGYLIALYKGGRPWLSIVEECRYLANTWLDSLVSSLQVTNEILERAEQRWAILLDELEIVPQQILSGIVQALRSTDPRIKFKLAISPAGTDLMLGGDSSSPSQENDYRAIPLWYERRADARVFSEKLFSRSLFGEEKSPAELKKLLRGSRIQSDDEDASLDYSDVIKKHRVDAFISLYAKDPSFRAELDKKGVDPTSPPLSDASKVGTYVRKITPLVLLRDRELKHFKNGEGVRRGGRKSSDAYIGYPNIIDLAEGNPRWILTLADLMKVETGVSEPNAGSQGVQSKALSDFTSQFVSKLTVYPTGSRNSKHAWTLMKFVDTLGEQLESTLYRREFSADPALSFTLDEKSIEQYGNYIKLCIDLGALVIIRGGSAPLGEAGAGSSLTGARVRISYRLAPRYQLPLRSTKERSLSGAIRGGDRTQGTLDVAELSSDSVEQRPARSGEKIVESIDSVPQQGRLL